MAAPPASEPITFKLVAAVAREMLTAAKEGRQLDYSRRPTTVWARAVSLLLTMGRLDAGRKALEGLMQAVPDLRSTATFAGLFDLMPPITRQPKFVNDINAERQVVRVPGADTALICFAGRGIIGTGVPLPMLHRWLGLLGVHLIYLRTNREQLLYMTGLETLGPDRPSTVAALKRTLEEIGARRAFCYGNSAGGFAALHYAVELAADGAIGMAAATNMDPAFTSHLNLRNVSAQLARRMPGEPLDLKPMYAAADPRPRLLLAYGERNWDDRLYAEHMADLDGVETHEIAGYGSHHVISELMLRGDYLPLLQRFMGIESADVSRETK